jgi:hypothetical protein
MVGGNKLLVVRCVFPHVLYHPRADCSIMALVAI